MEMEPPGLPLREVPRNTPTRLNHPLLLLPASKRRASAATAGFYMAPVSDVLRFTGPAANAPVSDDIARCDRAGSRRRPSGSVDVATGPG